MDQYSREFIAEKARLRPEDLGLVRTARRSHNQLGLAYQIAFIRLTGRAPGQQPFEILEDLVGDVSCEAKGLAYKFARVGYPFDSGSHKMLWSRESIYQEANPEVTALARRGAA